MNAPIVPASEGNMAMNYIEQMESRIKILFESRGYVRTQTSRFEDYSIFMAHKRFLNSGATITFMDMNGRLKALKPDATLSIVKNVPPEPLTSFKKLYYCDDVYRNEFKSKEYKVIRQAGAELIGPVDSFSELETLCLACESLATIHSHYILDISHQGFITAVIEKTGLPDSAQNEITAAIKNKSHHDLMRLCEQYALPADAQNRLVQLFEISGNPDKALKKAAALVCCPQSESAFKNLQHIFHALHVLGMGDKVNLDFSVASDVDYYNGITFSGYIEGVSTAVLSGGRYDNLMHRMDKENSAIGFAVNLTELAGGMPTGEKLPHFDIVVYYAKDASAAGLMQLINGFRQEGKKVRAEPLTAFSDGGADFNYVRRCRYTTQGLEEI